MSKIAQKKARVSLEKTRLTLEVPNSIRDKMESLIEQSHASSLTDVIRKSVALLDLYLEHVGAGGRVIFRHADGFEETIKVI